MPRTLQTLKDQAPSIYWFAVDSAAAGKSAAWITREIAWRVEAHNELAAIKGKPTIQVSF